MEVVNEAFQEVKEMLSSVVPPFTATIDNRAKYEVRALKPAAGNASAADRLFGSLVLHADSVTVEFDHTIGKAKKRELFSGYLLQKMNDEGRIRIHAMTRQLHEDLQNAVQSLYRYYNDEGWI